MKSNKFSPAGLIFFLLLFCHAGWTQSSINIGTAISSGTKSLPPNGRLGLGGSIEYSGHLFKGANIRGYIGYDYFAHNFPKLDTRLLQDTIAVLGIYGYAISLMPIRIGYEQYVFKEAAFVYAEVGISHLFPQDKYRSTGNASNLFSFTVGTGYRLHFQQSHIVQFSLFYNHNRLNEYRNLNYTSLRAAYGLPLGKVKRKDIAK